MSDEAMRAAYKAKQKAYLDALAACERAEAAFNNAESPEAVNTWRFMADDLRQSVRSAFDDWVANGFKNEVEAMTALISPETEHDSDTVESRAEKTGRERQ